MCTHTQATLRYILLFSILDDIYRHERTLQLVARNAHNIQCSVNYTTESNNTHNDTHLHTLCDASVCVGDEQAK